jgi:hypothetical protein
MTSNILDRETSGPWTRNRFRAADVQGDMTADTIWTDTLPEPDAARQDAARRRNRKATLAVLVSLVALAALAVGLVVLVGADASAVGGCGGG